MQKCPSATTTAALKSTFQVKFRQGKNDANRSTSCLPHCSTHQSVRFKSWNLDSRGATHKEKKQERKQVRKPKRPLRWSNVYHVHNLIARAIWMQTSICMENEDITQTLDFTYPKNSSCYCLKVQVIFQHFLSHTKSQTSLIGIPQLLWSSRERESSEKKWSCPNFLLH